MFFYNIFRMPKNGYKNRHGYKNRCYKNRHGLYISSSGFKVVIFLLQRKMQFWHILETFENFIKRKTLVGPQVIPRSFGIPRNFHLQHYSILGKNYKNVYHRKTSEGIEEQMNFRSI